MAETFVINWRSKEGYGDFITGIGYAYSSTIKYDRPVHIVFHWPNPKDHLLSLEDKESIFYRFEYIKDFMRPAENVTISHEFSSVPEYRFINELEEFNPLHGLWYPKNEVKEEHGLVVFWSSQHNLEFPGYHKDPLYDHWNVIIKQLKSIGYNVVEITYRTPISEVMDLMSRCEFGIGYEGMIHQLFKFMWKPLIVASKRVDLAKLLAIQAKVISRPEDIIGKDIYVHVKESKDNIKRLLIEHNEYMLDKQDPTKHRLYNKPIL